MTFTLSGPSGMAGEPELLTNCYRNSLALGAAHPLARFSGHVEARRFLAVNDMNTPVIFASFDIATVALCCAALGFD
jgi:hypothetical protein